MGKFQPRETTDEDIRLKVSEFAETDDPKDHEEDIVVRAKYGYEDLDEHTMICANCEKKLAVIKKVAKESMVNIFKAECPFCNDSSFKYKVTGKTYVGGTDITSLKDIQMTNSYVDNDVLIMEATITLCIHEDKYSE
jgi:hypothetical protein